MEEEEEEEEEESQSLADRTTKRASIGRTFPPLLSSSALREPWPEGGENELDDGVVEWRTNTQYSSGILHPALQRGKAAAEQRHEDPEVQKGHNRQIYGTIPTSNPVAIRGLLFGSGLMMSHGQLQRSHTRISSSSSSKKEEKLLSSSGGALKAWPLAGFSSRATEPELDMETLSRCFKCLGRVSGVYSGV
ncbi:hypothetical protein EYF80_018219 [Liparis tanakae]|uniref:Uncharacterized protein n=1 Tax=Liparis tanakae TaxID=230148 RepID=A0A4Z2I2R9_9TELE|nr:hypothetical protein EYF80_018219 [Liparis tanakae]